MHLAQSASMVDDPTEMLPILRILRTELFKLSNTPVSPLSLLIFVMGLAVTFVIARIARAGVTAFFARRAGAQVGTSYAAARIVQYVIVASGLLVCADTLGVDLGTLAAFGAVISVGVGFGLQSITHNFISGIILLIERPIQTGDFVVVGDVVGRVTEIEMRATKIVSRDGVAMIVPNSEFISGKVINQSHPTTRKRVRVALSVACGSDTARVRDTLVALALAHPMVLRQPEPMVYFRNFGDSSLDFELAVWLEQPDPEPIVSSDLRFEIDRVFRQKSIELAIPQRDIRLRQTAA